MNKPPTIVLMTFTQDPSQSQNPPDVGLTQKASSSVPQVAQHKHCPIDVLYMPVSKPIQWNPPVRKMEALNEHEVGWLSPQCYPKWTVSLVLCGALSASPGIRLAHSSIHSIKKKWKLSTFIKITLWEFLLFLSGLRTWLVSMRMQVQSLAQWVKDSALPWAMV